MKSLRLKVFFGVLSGLLLVTAVAELLLYRQAASFAEKELFTSLKKYAVALTEVAYIDSRIGFTLYPDWESRLRLSPEDQTRFFEFKTMDGHYLTDSHNLGGENLPEVGHHGGQTLVDYGNIVLGVYEHQFEITSDKLPTRQYKLVVAENTDLIRGARLSTLKRMLFFTPVALVAAFLISLALTTATLSSISRFTKRVQSYNRNDHGSRLDLDKIDKEMLPLGEALNKHIYELNKHSNLESKLLADTAHELRMPLSTMRKELDQLKLSIESPAELSMHAENLDSNLSGLQVMTDNMLMLYRIESGNYKPRRESIDLLAEVESIVRHFSGHEKTDIEISGEAAFVLSSRSVVSLILTRLLNNAIQHAGGADVSVNWIAVGDKVELHVDDAGPGIAEAEREKIFDRHYRFSDQKKSVSSGTGLGLALVRLYANSVNANTRCEESPLGGARFTVEFPCTRPSESTLSVTQGTNPELEGAEI